MNRKGQVAIFVIVAIVLVGAVVAYFAFTGRLGLGQGAGEFQPIFDRQKTCIEDATRGALELAGLQGGRITVGAYAPGSDYAPFSSHLNFLGSPVPYWYSLTSNGIFKENVPTKNEMQFEIASFIQDQLARCDFSDFYQQGYVIEKGNYKASVTLLDASVRVQVSQTFSVSREDASASASSQSVEVKSNFGKFYTVARTIYDKEKKDAFLESYAVDVLRNYAPVDGVALTCAPKIWKTQDVLNDLRSGLSSNIGAIKFKGSYYSLSSEENTYFVVDQQTSVPVQVMYNPSWPSVIDITPADESLLIAKPIGNDPALGAMGFCYVPYHFVYDIKIPVLFQLYDGETLFQFPVVAVIDNNVPRTAVLGESVSEDQPDVCAFKTTPVTIATYNRELQPVEASVSYHCFDSLCDAGTTSLNGNEASVQTLVPACVNGIVHAHAEGYADTQALFSSNSESRAELIMERLHDVQLDVRVDGQSLQGTAIVQLVSPEKTVSAAYPEVSQISLSEGSYNVTVYVYGNSSITIPASTKTECQTITRPGLAGFFGGTKEQCFDITLPETTIDYALLGGGSSSVYLLESQLRNGILRIDVPSVPSPSTLEQAQYAFEIVQRSPVEVSS